MLDPKLLRQNIDAVVSGLKKRSFSFDIEFWKGSEEKRKSLQLGTEQLRAQRNQKSKEIGVSKAKGADTQEMREAVSVINLELKQKLVRKSTNCLFWTSYGFLDEIGRCALKTDVIGSSLQLLAER